ncbi:MAG: hypothetical protein K2Y37_06690 [Pirellulales bacterium]|nr:hypothetical protein [Pirellulales bacterium]
MRTIEQSDREAIESILAKRGVDRADYGHVFKMLVERNDDAGFRARVGTRDNYWQTLNDILKYLARPNAHLFPAGMKARRYPRIARFAA